MGQNVGIFFIIGFITIFVDSNIDKYRSIRKLNKVLDNFIKEIPKIKQEALLDTQKIKQI